LDPWVFLRLIFHLFHPRSMLSTPASVRKAFFGDEFPVEGVKEFEKWMPEYESSGWPGGMTKRNWIDVSSVLRNIDGLGSGTGASRVMAMAVEDDKLITVEMVQRTARDYREALSKMVKEKRIDAFAEVEVQGEDIMGVIVERKAGVTVVVVEGGGHHVQNDVQADNAAEALKRFVDGL